MRRYIPQCNLFEFGMFGGLFFPSKNHELGDPNKPLEPYAKVAPELGLRLAYFPLSFAGLEAEGAVMPTQTEDDAKAALWAVRGHVVAQLPLASIVPFVVVGGGALGTSSDTLGSDNDPAFHFGEWPDLRGDPLLLQAQRAQHERVHRGAGARVLRRQGAGQ